MTNILLEGYNIAKPWLLPALREHLSPGMTAAVVALSFRDSRVRSTSDWESLYGRQGKYYSGITAGLAAYGIAEEDVSFINYFSDTRASAAEKIREADVLYLPGGLPDRMMDRIRKLDLTDALLSHKGVVIGYSAGALIQLAEYHLSPDEDYPDFGYYQGLPYLNGFYLEPHYEALPEQDAAIQRVLSERKKPVYALRKDAGALIVEDGAISLLGQVLRFSPK